MQSTVPLKVSLIFAVTGETDAPFPARSYTVVPLWTLPSALSAQDAPLCSEHFPQRHIRDMLYNIHILHLSNAFVNPLFGESYGSLWQYFFCGIDKSKKMRYDIYT